MKQPAGFCSCCFCCCCCCCCCCSFQTATSQNNSISSINTQMILFFLFFFFTLFPYFLLVENPWWWSGNILSVPSSSVLCSSASLGDVTEFVVVVARFSRLAVAVLNFLCFSFIPSAQLFVSSSKLLPRNFFTSHFGRAFWLQVWSDCDRLSQLFQSERVAIGLWLI